MCGKDRMRLVAMVASMASTAVAAPLGTGFTYQGALKQSGTPVAGTAHFRFSLWDDPAIGAVLGSQIVSNVPVVSGLFTVTLNDANQFGASAFNGQARWLQVEVCTDATCASTTPLTPRQPVTPAPYALFAANSPWQTSGSNISNTNSGNVGIGDNSPAATLSVGVGGKLRVAGASGDLTLTDDQGSITFPAADATNAPMIQMFASGTANGDRMVIAHSAGFSDYGLQYQDATDRFNFLGNGSPVLGIDLSTLRVGVGTSSPSHRLDVDGPVRVRANANLNNLLITNASDDLNLDLIKDTATPVTVTASARIQFNGFSDQATHRGSLHFFTRDTGDADVVDRMNIDEAGALNVLGAATFSSPVNLSDTLAVTQNAAFSANATVNGSVGIGDSTPNARLDVQQSSNTVAIFNRTTNDGTIVALQQDSITEGTISVSVNTVSYNAFTGSHYAWSKEALLYGQLVSMTGENRRLHDAPDAEVIYGVEMTAVENDPKCLGSYLGPQDASLLIGRENPLLVMAVGNGDMWVVDTGRNIEPGDYLITSKVRGCARRDDPSRFAASNIVARAAERVDWATIPKNVGAPRKKRISVLFGNFIRGSDHTKLQKLVARQRREIDQLHSEHAEMQEALERVLNEIRQVKAELRQGPYRSLEVAQAGR